MNQLNPQTPCPCESGQTFLTCCLPYLSGQSLPPTPEALMRSRYTAYTHGNIDYIEKTMKPPASDNFSANDAREWATFLHWQGLKIVQTSQDEDHGFVEFIAHFTQNHTKHVLHEISEFRREQGQWYYIDGKRPEPNQARKKNIGRNDACPCGSGKKYKKCCGV